MPAEYVPTVLQRVLQDYLVKSRDPLVPNTWLPRYAWFRMSLLSEFVLQVPAFVVGLYVFWNNDPRGYPILIAYGAIACFTTLQCIAMVTMGEERTHLAPENLLFILQYVTYGRLIQKLYSVYAVSRCDHVGYAGTHYAQNARYDTRPRQDAVGLQGRDHDCITLVKEGYFEQG